VCVSVADVKEVGSVFVDPDDDDDDPAEDADEEDEAASDSITSSSLVASGVENRANDFCTNLSADERFPAARCLWDILRQRSASSLLLSISIIRDMRYLQQKQE
jgi:hypothetical protein